MVEESPTRSALRKWQDEHLGRPPVLHFGWPDLQVLENPYRPVLPNPCQKDADVVLGMHKFEDMIKFRKFKAFVKWRQVAYEMAWFDKDVWKPWSGLSESTFQKQLSWRSTELRQVEQSHSSSSTTQVQNKKSKVEVSAEQEVCPCLMCKVARCVWGPA